LLVPYGRSKTRKGVHLPSLSNQFAMMAQMQNILDFPPPIQRGGLLARGRRGA